MIRTPTLKEKFPYNRINMINIVVAIARNRAIGYQNQLIYRLPNDLKHFRELTTGHTVIMGRKTFDSLPKGALPNRRNIVLTRDTTLLLPGTEIFHSLEAALSAVGTEKEIFIIGGASVYQQAMEITDQIHLTLVDDIPEKADTFFPEIDPGKWQAVGKESHHADERHPFLYSFIQLKRTGK